MNTAEIKLNVGNGLSSSQLLSALDDHESEIKGLLLADLDYLDTRATCDGFYLDEVAVDEGTYVLRYHYDWSAFYGCKDADRADTVFGETPLHYEGGRVTIKHDVRPQRFPNEEF